jgi:hypothetical protein
MDQSHPVKSAFPYLYQKVTTALEVPTFLHSWGTNLTLNGLQNTAYGSVPSEYTDESWRGRFKLQML